MHFTPPTVLLTSQLHLHHAYIELHPISFFFPLHFVYIFSESTHSHWSPSETLFISANSAVLPPLNPPHIDEFLKNKKKRMGQLLRAEREGPKFLEGYPQVKDTMKKARWLQFIQNVKDYNK